MTTTTTKSATTSKKVRTAPAIPVDAENFSGKVRDALTKSVSQGVGEVRVRVEDSSDRATVRKVQKRVQGIGYSSGFNANFRVTLAGDILTGKVVDLTVTDQRPGHTDPTPKTPGTRSTFVGWDPKKIAQWKKDNPVKVAGTPTATPKKTTGTPTKKTPTTPRKVRTVRKVSTTGTPTPDSLKGVTSATPVDTATVTVTKKS